MGMLIGLVHRYSTCGSRQPTIPICMAPRLRLQAAFPSLPAKQCVSTGHHQLLLVMSVHPCSCPVRSYCVVHSTVHLVPEHTGAKTGTQHPYCGCASRGVVNHAKLASDSDESRMLRFITSSCVASWLQEINSCVISNVRVCFNYFTNYFTKNESMTLILALAFSIISVGVVEVRPA